MSSVGRSVEKPLRVVKSFPGPKDRPSTIPKLDTARAPALHNRLDRIGTSQKASDMIPLKLWVENSVGDC